MLLFFVSFKPNTLCYMNSKCDMFLYVGIYILFEPSVIEKNLNFPLAFLFISFLFPCVFLCFFCFAVLVALLGAMWREQEKFRFSAHFWTSRDDALHSNSLFKQRQTNSGNDFDMHQTWNVLALENWWMWQLKQNALRHSNDIALRTFRATFKRNRIIVEL